MFRDIRSLVEQSTLSPLHGELESTAVEYSKYLSWYVAATNLSR